MPAFSCNYLSKCFSSTGRIQDKSRKIPTLEELGLEGNSMKFLKKANELTDFNPQLTKAIQIGADMRMIFIDNEQGEGFPNSSTFFQMQGDLYFNVKMNKYLSLMIAPGLYIPSTFGVSGVWFFCP